MLITPKPVHDKHEKQGSADDIEHAFSLLISRYASVYEMTASELANFEDTPVRAAKAFRELVWNKKGIIGELKHQLSTGFPMEPTNESSDVIVQGPIKIQSLCPHHLLAVGYEAFVAYKPKQNGVVLGLSKLARVAQILGKRPVLQEQLTRDIADVLFYRDETKVNISVNISSGQMTKTENIVPCPFPQIESVGSAVQLLGRHSCMSCRGVKEDAITLTTALRGIFLDSHLKAEFYNAIQSIRRAK